MGRRWLSVRGWEKVGKETENPSLQNSHRTVAQKYPSNTHTHTRLHIHTRIYTLIYKHTRTHKYILNTHTARAEYWNQMDRFGGEIRFLIKSHWLFIFSIRVSVCVCVCWHDNTKGGGSGGGVGGGGGGREIMHDGSFIEEHSTYTGTE